MIKALPLVAVLFVTTAHANDHVDARIFVIRSQIAQAGQGPVLFVGDSIVESALLPAEVCGHRIVNAGIGGTTTDSYRAALGRIGAFKAAATVVAIGTNEGYPDALPGFSQRYHYLAFSLRLHSTTVLFAGIPPIERGTQSELDPQSADSINGSIREYAGRQFVDIRASLAPIKKQTIDGVHLSVEAQSVWLDAVLSRLKLSLGC